MNTTQRHSLAGTLPLALSCSFRALIFAGLMTNTDFKFVIIEWHELDDYLFNISQQVWVIPTWWPKLCCNRHCRGCDHWSCSPSDLVLAPGPASAFQSLLQPDVLNQVPERYWSCSSMWEHLPPIISINQIITSLGMFLLRRSIVIHSACASLGGVKSQLWQLECQPKHPMHHFSYSAEYNS